MRGGNRLFNMQDFINSHSEWHLLPEAAAELELVLGSSGTPPLSRNMVTAISRLLLHASSMCLPTLSVAPDNQNSTSCMCTQA